MGLFDAITAAKQQIAKASAEAVAQNSAKPTKEEKKSAEKKPVDSFEVVSIPLFLGFSVPVVTKSDQNSAGSKASQKSGPGKGQSYKEASQAPRRLPDWITQF